MNDHDDKKLAELFKAARSAPRPGWEARALTAMLHTRAIKSAPRFRTLAVAMEVSLVMFALGLAPFSKGVPIGGVNYALAAQIALADEALPKAQAKERKPQTPEEWQYEAGYPIDRSLDEYQQRATGFVREHYPNDADMLMAAGLLTTDDKERRSLLKEAAMKSKKPVAWAAYVSYLYSNSPRYTHPGAWGVDPELAWTKDRYQQDLKNIPNIPTKLSEKQAAPFLEALRGWEAADPQNALPVGLQVYLLYGLQKNAEARATWKRAGRLPRIDDYDQEKKQIIARLLNRMGMGEAEAVLAGNNNTLLYLDLYTLRTGGRISHYEGRLAQMQGRSKEAVELWNATTNLGINMQDSAKSQIPYLVGSAMEAIGAVPAWKWYSAKYTQTSSGPLNDGSIYYGRQHAFYVAQVGEQADAQVRDRLVLSQSRKALFSKHFMQLQLSFFNPLRSSNMLLIFSRIVALALLAFVVIFAAISLRARGAADEAASLRTWARAAILLLIFLPLYYSGQLLWKAVFQEQPHFSYRPFIAGSAVSLAVLLIAPLLSALFRRPSARLITTWRGNLRKLLPAAIVLCALISLGLGISGRIVRSNFIRAWYSPTYNEMAKIKQFIGPEWDHPKIPAGAWHAEYPPKRP